jgi:acid phosphatase family membrane protein YuiD
MIEEIAKGKLAQHKRLQEVLGHTPIEAILGALLGLGIATLAWFLIP